MYACKVKTNAQIEESTVSLCCSCHICKKVGSPDNVIHGGLDIHRTATDCTFSHRRAAWCGFL